MGDVQARDLGRFLMSLVEKEGLKQFPKVLIIGTKKIEDTDFLSLTKNDLIENRIYYLSAEEGLDYIAFKKASLH